MPLQWKDRNFGTRDPERHADSSIGPVKILTGMSGLEKFIQFLYGEKLASYETGNAYAHLMMFAPGNEHGPWIQIQNFQYATAHVPYHMPAEAFNKLDRETKIEVFKTAQELAVKELMQYADEILQPSKTETLASEVLHDLMSELGEILADDVLVGAGPGESDVEKSAGYLARRVKARLEERARPQRFPKRKSTESTGAPWHTPKETPTERADQAAFHKRVLDDLIAEADKKKVAVIDDSEADLAPRVVETPK